MIILGTKLLHVYHPCPNFHDGLVKSPLKLRHRRANTHHICAMIYLLIHALAMDEPCLQINYHSGIFGLKTLTRSTQTVKYNHCSVCNSLSLILSDCHFYELFGKTSGQIGVI